MEPKTHPEPKIYDHGYAKESAWLDRMEYLPADDIDAVLEMVEAHQELDADGNKYQIICSVVPASIAPAMRVAGQALLDLVSTAATIGHDRAHRGPLAGNSSGPDEDVIKQMLKNMGIKV